MGWGASALSVGLLAVSVSAFAGCSGERASAKGQLLVVMHTDMEVPKDVSAIRIAILKNGAIKFDTRYPVGPGDATLPASLAVEASDNPGDTVEVRVLSFRGAAVHTLNKAITTVPQHRLARLTIPIQWLCWDQVEPTEGLPDSFDSTCPIVNGKEQACIAGECRDVDLDSAKLPDFDWADVYGGGARAEDGLCFDTATCLDAGFDVVPEADCTFEVTAGEARELNLGVLMPDSSIGICSDSSGACYVPLDFDDSHGWALASDLEDLDDSDAVTVELPSAVCDRIDTGAVLGVRASTDCPTKTETTPTCGPWSSVTKSSKAGSGTCVPDCLGRECGGDGCGGTCGDVCDALETCQQGVCVFSGDPRVTLTWSGTYDLDLRVLTPCGDEISYEDSVACGGTLDNDVQCEKAGGPENIAWEPGMASAGDYQVDVEYFNQCEGEDPDAVEVDYEVEVEIGGDSTVYSGTLTSLGERQTVTTFSLP